MNDKTKTPATLTSFAVTFKYVNDKALLRNGVIVVEAVTPDEAKILAAALLKQAAFNNPKVISARPY